MAVALREEVLNVVLAELLAGYGVSARPETIQRKRVGRGHALPDVLVEYRGMRIAIEGKYASSPKADDTVADQARSRISSGIAQIALAVKYPSHLRSCEFELLKQEMASCRLEYAVFSEVDHGSWRDGNAEEVLSELRRAHQGMCKEDVVQQAAESIKGCLDGVAQLFAQNKAICSQLSTVLGIGEPGKEDSETKRRRIETITRISALTLENAFIFQEQLAASGVENVASLRDLLRSKDVVSKSLETWDWICKNINYVPIFRLAADILAKVPGGNASNGAVRTLAAKAIEVSNNEAALRHDLMGRIYHYLLHEAKYLGTYYTSVPAATILAKLALQPEKWPGRDFGNERTLSSLRVVDLTCGTGTLLMAACQALSDNFIVSNAKTNDPITPKRLSVLHASLMEGVMHGFDVLPSAIHLTASTLSLLAPEVLFHNLHLYSMPLGVFDGKSALGSLEFLDQRISQTQLSLFGGDSNSSESRRYTRKGLTGAAAEVPETDLFLMNPPFTRSVGDNLLFGNLPEDKRAAMQKDLKVRVQARKLSANITAGLGSVFFAVADRYVKHGGRVAFVLPGALSSGIAWEETRKLIQAKYHLEYVIISHDAERWNFSENTDLSELMFIARRLRDGEDNSDRQATFVNLWRNPSSSGDGLAVARLIQRTKPGDLLDPRDSGVASLVEAGTKYGEAISIPMKGIGETWWPASFAQTDLAKVAFFLRDGRITIPGSKKTWPLPMARLFQIAELGPDQRDIHDGFEVGRSPTSYKAFWNHDAHKTLSIKQRANAFLSPRTKPAAGRDRVRDIKLLWPKASALLFSERLRLNTQRVNAVLLEDEVLANTWWPVRLRKPDNRKDKALVLWQNSSLGITSLTFSRITSEGAWVKFKKPALQLMPVLNVDSLTSSQLDQLAQHYDRLGGLELQPFSKIADDDVRAAIDLAVTSVLGVPDDLTSLREMLGREPVITNRSILAEEPVAAAEDEPQMQLLFA